MPLSLMVPEVGFFPHCIELASGCAISYKFLKGRELRQRPVIVPPNVFVT